MALLGLETDVTVPPPVPVVLPAVQAQVKSCVAPPAMLADAGVEEDGQVAPAPPTVRAEGATAVTDPWPVFVTESVTVSGLPWLTGSGAAVIVVVRPAAAWVGVSDARQSRMSTGTPESRSG